MPLVHHPRKTLYIKHQIKIKFPHLKYNQLNLKITDNESRRIIKKPKESIMEIHNIQQKTLRTNNKYNNNQKKKKKRKTVDKFLQNIPPFLITNPYATHRPLLSFPDPLHKRFTNQFTPVPPIHPNLRGQWFQRESTGRRHGKGERAYR